MLFHEQNRSGGEYEEVSFLDTVFLNFVEYSHRFKRLVKYCLIYLCGVVLPVVLLSAVFVFRDIPALLECGTSDLLDSIVSAIRSPDSFLATLWMLTVVLFGMVFSGSIVAVFLDPINPIKIAPFVIINEKRGCLSIRYWVCYQKGKYLNNLSLCLYKHYKDRYESSCVVLDEGHEGNKEFLCKTSLELQRGFWKVDIPFGSDACRSLLGLFQSKLPEEKPSLRLVIKGYTNSGEMVFRLQDFGINRFVSGYEYASCRYGTENWDPSASPRHRKCWFSNFPKIICLKEVEGKPCVNLSTRERFGIPSYWTPKSAGRKYAEQCYDLYAWMELEKGISEEDWISKEALKRILVTKGRFEWKPANSLVSVIDLSMKFAKYPACRAEVEKEHFEGKFAN